MSVNDALLVGFNAVIDRHCGQREDTLGNASYEALSLQIQVAQLEVLMEIRDRLPTEKGETMSDKSLADRLRVIVAWIRDGGEGCVRQPDPDQLEGIADEVEALVDQNNDELRFENNRLRDRIAKLEAALQQIAGGHGISDEILEAALIDKGVLYAWCQEVARAALDAEKVGGEG